MIIRLIPICLFVPVVCHGAVIFETDFSGDLGYYSSGVSMHDTINVPTGWSGVQSQGSAAIEVVSEPAIASKPILKLTWQPNTVGNTIRLVKHLSGTEGVGYSELYIRYKVRLPANFRIGDESDSAPYWKWGRLWQNTTPDNSGDWTENRAVDEDSGFVVWNFAGEHAYRDANIVFSDNSDGGNESGSTGDLATGSVSGPRYAVDYWDGGVGSSYPGTFEAMSGWDAYAPGESTDDNIGRLKDTNQTWHTIEWHFKLATSAAAEDGAFEMWFDGVKQVGTNAINSQGWTTFTDTNAYDTGHESIFTEAVSPGNGWDFFVMFDNIAGWSEDWAAEDVDGFIYVSDVVVSTTYIGNAYEVGESTPSDSTSAVIHAGMGRLAAGQSSVMVQ